MWITMVYSFVLQDRGATEYKKDSMWCKEWACNGDHMSHHMHKCLTDLLLFLCPTQIPSLLLSFIFVLSVKQNHISSLIYSSISLFVPLYSFL